jgi:hypothetical protein
MRDRQPSQSRSNLGDRNHLTTSRSNPTHVMTLSTYRASTTRVHDTRSVAADCRRGWTRSTTPRAPCTLPRLRTAVSSRRPASASPPKPEIYPTARLGGLSKRPTPGRRDGFRGGTSDPSQRKPCLEAGGGAAPGGTPVCPQPAPRVRRSGAPDVQQPPSQLGCGVGTSPAS